MSIVDRFEAVTDSFARTFIEWANPAVSFDERATAGWLLTRLDHALYIIAAYGILVGIGFAIRPSDWKQQAAAKKKKQEDARKRGEKKNPWKAFAADPMLIVQAVYNITQVLLCLWMVVATLVLHQRREYGLLCLPFDVQDKEMAFLLHVFYLSKVLDFMDTFFIIFRGGWVRLSFLHIYHHASIFLVYWMNINAGYAGDVYFTIVANGSIHFAMYLYYLLASIGRTPSWGKYLTMAQMAQFVMMNIQAGYILMNPEECAYPRRMTMVYLFYIQSLFALFMNFFLNKHGGSGKKKKKSA